MRLVTWNCRMAVHKKIAALRELNPDVAVVQECAEDSVPAAAPAYEGCTSKAWSGPGPRKGLAILAFGDTSFSLVSKSGTAIAVRVTSRSLVFNLLAKWAWAKSPSLSRYVKDVRSSLDEHETFLREGPSVLAGDLNSGGVFDKLTGAAHAKLVNQLQKLGLTSAYHSHFSEAHGEESRKTFFRGKPAGQFHIDYVFLPDEWARRATVEIPQPEPWLKLSDHVPVIVDID